MKVLNPYLIFNGNCEEVFTFYKKVFGGEFGMISRFKDMPPENGCEPLAEDWQDKIMHVSLLVNESVTLMGGDINPNIGEVNFGRNFHLSIGAESKEEADKIYAELAEEGSVTMPIADTFWGDYFGMLTDKFGIRWMVNYSKN